MARPRISFPPGARQSLLLMATTTGLRETVAAEAVEILRKLDKGDAVAIAGTGKPSAWINKDGQPVAGMDVLADSAMTTYAAGKKRDKFRQVSGQDRQVKPKQSTARQNADSGELMDDLPWD